MSVIAKFRICFDSYLSVDYILLQGGRVRYTSNGESTGVISLRSAGDISLPQRGPPRRGLIVPQQPPNPPTIIPLTHAR